MVSMNTAKRVEMPVANQHQTPTWRQVRNKTMRMIIAELSLELEQAKAELAGVSGAAVLPNRR